MQSILGAHVLSTFTRKIVEHKRFRSVAAACLVMTVLIASHLNTASAFTASDFQTQLATEEVILTTRRTSRLPVVGRLSQGFTYYHPGIDIERTFNDPIYSFIPGVVAETGFQSGGYGNYILINHQNGYFSLYAHLNNILVKKDEEVSQDTPIGTVGLTGRTTGSHLHFEIYENGIAVNPLSVLPQSTLATASPNSMYTGGPQSIPSHTLVLLISQQIPVYVASTSASQATTMVEKVEQKLEEQNFGIWLPDGLTDINQQQTWGQAGSAASRLLPTLGEF